jgi:hypothetical protein
VALARGEDVKLEEPERVDMRDRAAARADLDHVDQRRFTGIPPPA